MSTKNFIKANKGLFKPIDLQHQSLLIIKNDAIEDNCIPQILDIIAENNLKIDSIIPLTFTLDDGLFLYKDNVDNAQNEEHRQFKLMGADNLVGLNLVLALSSKNRRNPWKVINSIKGFNHTSEKNTIRGLLCHNIPDELEQYEVYRLAIRNRIHTAKDKNELNTMVELLKMKGINIFNESEVNEFN